jgi:hypothetical protein
MQVLKMSFVVIGLVFLSSFTLAPTESNGRISAKYRAAKYEQFLGKFETVKSLDEIILDVRIHQPLPVSEAEFQATNLDRQVVRKVIEKRMLLSDFDLFLPEITHKRKGGLRPNTYEAECLVKSTNKFDLVIYSEYVDARQYHKNYYLATFSKTGVILAKKPIGISNQYAYTEAKLNSYWFTTTSVLEGQKLPLNIKKFKIEQKGAVELLGEVHPYLDAATDKFKVITPENYRLRVE